MDIDGHIRRLSRLVSLLKEDYSNDKMANEALELLGKLIITLVQLSHKQ